MADSDLTLPATVAAELGVTASDPKLPRYVSVMSDAVRRFINRPRVHYGAGIVEMVRSFNRHRLVLAVTPILGNVAVQFDDGTVVSTADYSIEDADAGLLFRSGGWPYTGSLRPGLLYADRDPGSERASVQVTYDAGWVTPAQAASSSWSGPVRSLPYDIEEACVQGCVALYRRSGEDARVQSESLGDYSVSYLQNVSHLPPTALALLEPYRRPLG